MRIQKKILNKLHVVIGPLVKRYLSKPRMYRKRGVSVLVLPSVFHPGFFFSTGLLTDYVSGLDLKEKKILELGAGSGFLSIVCAKMGAHVTSSDINPTAIKGLIHNAALNHVNPEIVHSDLFDGLAGRYFDLIVINPPYYRKEVTGAFDYAWYCGENFEYFTKLFRQLGDVLRAHEQTRVIMVLSEDCALSVIMSMAREENLAMKMFLSKVIWGEENYLFELHFHI